MSDLRRSGDIGAQLQNTRRYPYRSTYQHKRAEDKLVFDLQNQVANTWSDMTIHRRSGRKLMPDFYRATKSVKQLNGILLPMLQNRIIPSPKHVTHPIDDDYYQINNQVAAKDIRIFCSQLSSDFKNHPNSTTP